MYVLRLAGLKLNKKMLLLGLALVLLSCLDFTISQHKTAWYPNYHVAPIQGWMNDPNGLSYHNGYYHAFWQYNPYNTLPGQLMHWGHARSTNMLTWEHLPIALTPSLPEDIDGIFSGSAVIIDGNLTLIYTGVSENSTRQRQMAATSATGVDFKKLGVIIDREDGSEADFRDPKAWWQNDSWFVVIGTKTPDQRGEVLLYKSKDFVNWTFDRSLAQADDKLGYMWECPDFFTLGNKQLLVISPQGLEQDGYNYQNLYQTGYFVGSWKPGSNYTIEKSFREIDHGHDFYAAQTFLAPDGRRILIGWMAMWESPFPENVYGWSSMFTLPRELTLTKSGDLRVRPIREIRNLRVEKYTSNNLSFRLKRKTSFQLLSSKMYSNEILVEFNLRRTSCVTFGVELKEKERHNRVPFEGVKLSVDRSESRLFLERYYPQQNVSSSVRSVSIDLTLPVLSLNIFIDGSSIEVFVNDGQGVLSSRIYPTDKQRSFFIHGEDGLLSVRKFTTWDI